MLFCLLCVVYLCLVLVGSCMFVYLVYVIVFLKVMCIIGCCRWLLIEDLGLKGWCYIVLGC